MAMQVKDIMKTKIEVIQADDKLSKAASQMHQQGLDMFLVHEDNILVGTLSSWDLYFWARANGGSPNRSRVRSIMRSNMIACYEDEALEESNLQRALKRLGHLLVINRQGEMVGVLSQRDVFGQGGGTILEDLFKNLGQHEET